MAAFAVWGWYSDDATTPVPVFDATTVTPSSGQWTYDGTRYWLLGKTYNFTALHPAGVENVTAADDGSITIKGFDATQSRDLMTASVSAINYATVEAIQAVGFTFSHLLARVQVEGAVSGGGKVRVEEISLEGVKTVATYANGGWVLPDNTGEYTRGGFTLATVTPTDIFGDIMVIPQPTGAMRMVVSYYANDETELSYAESALPAGEVAQWEAGNSYRYRFTINEVGDILFARPTVTAWSKAAGGLVTVE